MRGGNTNETDLITVTIGRQARAKKFKFVANIEERGHKP